MKTIDKLEIILQKMKEQNNRLERIYGKHLKLIVCTGKRSEKVKFKHEALKCYVYNLFRQHSKLQTNTLKYFDLVLKVYYFVESNQFIITI